MNEVKLKRIIESFYEINRLSDKRMIGLRKIIQNQEKRIELLTTRLTDVAIQVNSQLIKNEELTKQVNHLRLNQVVRPDKIIKIPEMKK